jgi:hypothetical protein
MTKSNASVKLEGQGCPVIDRKYKVKATLTFDPLTPKSIGGHLLVKTNAPTKFEGQQPIACQVIDRKPFHLQGQCNLDL